MAYNEKLANRIRESLQHLPNIEEKEVMGGLTFMVNDKMCRYYQRRNDVSH